MTLDLLLSDVDIWHVRANSYRSEPAIESSISAMTKKSFQPDISLISELHNSFPFLRVQDEDSRTIRGPADLVRGLAVAAELQAIKDRAAEITLSYNNVRGRIERLYDIVKTNVLIKKEVMALKNDQQRTAVVSLVCPEIEDRLAEVNRVLSAADTITRNVNQSYNILKLQVDIVKEMMYEGGLTKAIRGGDRS